MAYQSKRRKECGKLFERGKRYSIQEAVSILKKAPKLKFDETVELSFKLNFDPKQTTQAVRGTLVLPFGLGKKVRVAVFCGKEEDVNAAKESGADFIGAGDLMEKVSSGWMDFDAAITTPEMMKEVGKLGKILGPRGLMPTPKAGTVTTEVAKAVRELKAGRIEFKMDKQANIHAPIGKLSFEEDALCQNGKALIEAVLRARPISAKGQFIKFASISSTMGPGLKLAI